MGGNSGFVNPEAADRSEPAAVLGFAQPRRSLFVVRMSPSPSPEFLDCFRRAAGAAGAVSFERFMELALFEPGVGYYRREARRVGYGADTDFYTASTSGPIFGELVAAAAAKLVRDHGGDPAALEFVEVGAETAGGILEGVGHPFGSSRVLRLGDALDLRGASVLFSNELFDAQPCRRFVRRGGAWLEAGVVEKDGALGEQLLGPVSENWLPADAPDGYRFDAPRAAAALAARLAAGAWSGLFLAFDYGKSLAELAHETPAGTVRAYHRHRQVTDLLAQPGQQDLTCHLCWDWIADALEGASFLKPSLESQETFFVKHAGAHIAAEIEREARGASPRKLALVQLLHPAHLGRKFQVMHAWRAQPAAK
ncbi:hypothetical protein GALL_09440 [mine drainage metagenome]|uniref:SAM-dependent methyltransferase n=1 Tax=mine drainage metagenome TaxID=410659 RepID=A0A1J5TCG6_9ZZZZ